MSLHCNSACPRDTDHQSEFGLEVLRYLVARAQTTRNSEQEKSRWTHCSRVTHSSFRRWALTKNVERCRNQEAIANYLTNTQRRGHIDQ